jgi:hypothetical protein
MTSPGAALGQGRTGRWAPQDRFDPQRLSPTEKRDRLELTEKKDLHVREGDRIRWTANDKPRDLHNAALARIISADARASPSRRRAIRP